MQFLRVSIDDVNDTKKVVMLQPFEPFGAFSPKQRLPVALS
jgi:hypothetical protein